MKKTLLSNGKNMKHISAIQSLNLEIIDICNLRCHMCDIWKNKHQHILSATDIRHILASSYIDEYTDITLTGGEPLLHPDITGVFQAIHEAGLRVSTLSTNGVLWPALEKLLVFCRGNNIPFPGIHISLDGLEQTHDTQRGQAGSFKKSLSTIINLRKNYPDIHIKIKYTITALNIADIQAAAKLAEKLGVDIAFKIVEYDDFYTNRLSEPELLSDIQRQEILLRLQTIYPNPDPYVARLLFYIVHGHINFDCSTPRDTLFIMADGSVYGCTKYKSIGNFKVSGIDEVVGNHGHKALIKKIKDIQCRKCFSLHGSYNSLK